MENVNVYRVFIHEGRCRINGCGVSGRVAVGDCCSRRCWVWVLSVVLQLIPRSVVHTKMPSIFIVPQPFKETDGRTAWSREESGDEARKRQISASVTFTAFLLFFYFVGQTWERKHPSAARSGGVFVTFSVRQKLPPPFPPPQSSPVWSSHVTFNNSEMSWNKQLWRCERTHPPSCGHPCSLWHLGRPEGPN